MAKWVANSERVSNPVYHRSRFPGEILGNKKKVDGIMPPATDFLKD